MMSAEAPATPEVVAETSAARLSIRGMFIITAVVAIVAALLGWLVRDLEQVDKASLLVAWAIWLAMCIGWASYQVRSRWAAEKAIGTTYLRLPMFEERWPEIASRRRYFSAVSPLFFVTIAFWIYSNLAIELLTEKSVFLWLFAGALLLFEALQVAKLVAMFWWRTHVRIGEHGILWDRTVLRWDHIVEHRLEPAEEPLLELKAIDQRNGEIALNIPVPPAQFDALKSIVHSHIVLEPSIPDRPSEVDLSRVPLSRVIRSPHLLPYIARFAVYFVLVVTAFLMIPAGITGVREFDHATLVGIVLRVALYPIRRRATINRAGRPRVRLSGRHGWPNVLAMIVSFFALYELGRTFGVTNEWIGYAAGTLFGWLTAALIGSVMWKQLDLRENLVLLHGTYVWPWHNVTLMDWQSNTGRLVLECRWRYIVARVPSDQREAVTRLLREKLAGELVIAPAAESARG